MSTTGTIMGVSKHLKSKKQDINIVEVQPIEGARILGIRRWTKAYFTSIYEPASVDRIIDVSEFDDQTMSRRLIVEKGLFCGVFSGRAVHAAMKLLPDVRDAVIVCIICDGGDRYVSTNVF
jgi:cysteine synthase B